MQITANHNISLTKALRQRFSYRELQHAKNEIKSFLKFQVTLPEMTAMISYYLLIQNQPPVL